MNLFEVLFSEGELATGNSGLAMFVRKNEDGDFLFVLYDVNMAKQQLVGMRKQGDVRELANKLKSRAMIAMTVLRPPNQDSGPCLGAWNVALSARNPSWKGYGQKLYAIAADYLNKPITSDRVSGTSELARKTWNRIATSSEFQQVGTFDSFDYNKGNKRYYDIDLSNNSTSRRWGPRTKETSDDCAIPGFPDEESLSNRVKHTGTIKAFKAGSTGVDAFELIDNHYEFLKAAEQAGFSVNDLSEVFGKGSSLLFTSQYTSQFV